MIKSIPLEQGLRPGNVGAVKRVVTVIKSIPLEQGLRLVTISELLSSPPLD